MCSQCQLCTVQCCWPQCCPQQCPRTSRWKEKKKRAMSREQLEQAKQQTPAIVSFNINGAQVKCLQPFHPNDDIWVELRGPAILAVANFFKTQLDAEAYNKRTYQRGNAYYKKKKRTMNGEPPDEEQLGQHMCM